MVSGSLEHLSRFTRVYHNARVRVCTLVFLSILGAGVACAQSLKNGEVKSEGLSGWGPAQDGVRTGLSARDKEFSLGKPIVVRLVMENVGNRVVQYDAGQVAVNSSMSIERDGGVKVPFVAMPAQTGGGSRPLKPGEECVLFETLDIADQYLITSPGTYTVRFQGRDEGFGDVAIPPSNAITIRVADGPVRTSRVLARKLFDIGQAPEWQVGVVEEGEVVPLGRSSTAGTTLALSRAGRSKDEILRALIWVTAHPSAVEPANQGTGRERLSESIGRCPWGEVYLWSGTAPAKELNTVRKLIATALQVEAQ